MRFFPSYRLAGVVLFVSPLAAGAQLAGYAPASAKYRVSDETKVVQTVMGNTQEISTSSNQFLTLQLGGAAPAFDFKVTLDSLQISNSMGMPTPPTTELNGANVSAKLSPDGRITDPKALMTSGKELDGSIAQGLRQFLPVLRPGAKPGDTWVDSINLTGRQNGLDVTTTGARNYRYAGDTTIAGTRAARITAEATSKLSGKGVQQGQELTLEGTVKSTSLWLVSASGQFLGGTSTASGDLEITVAAMGMVIPMSQSVSSKVDRLP